MAELAGGLAAEAATGDLIEVKSAVAGLVEEDAGDLWTVEAFDQAAI